VKELIVNKEVINVLHSHIHTEVNTGVDRHRGRHCSNDKWYVASTHYKWYL